MITDLINAIKRWRNARKQYNRGWRWNFEYVLDMYDYDHIKKANAEGKEWKGCLLVTPDWLCKFSGHWVVDCNNHSIRKPEHDFCTWCEETFPGMSDLEQPVRFKHA